MKRTAIRAIGAAAAIAIAATVAPLAALEQGKTADGVAFMSGGIGSGEREQLARARDEFSLQVVTAARGSGAFLAAVELKITDAGGRTVFERPLEGPLLLLNLPPGRYGVEAKLRGQMQRVQTTIGSARREIYFYFDIDTDVRPRDAMPR